VDLARPERTDRKHRLAVGAQVRRWRSVRGLTLAQVAARSGLNVGYLSQIENDKASPSLAVLGSLADALDVPPAWFLMGDVAPPTVVRAAERPVGREDDGERLLNVDRGHWISSTFTHTDEAPTRVPEDPWSTPDCERVAAWSMPPSGNHSPSRPAAVVTIC